MSFPAHHIAQDSSFVRSGMITIGGYYASIKKLPLNSLGAGSSYWSIVAATVGSVAYGFRSNSIGDVDPSDGYNFARSYGLPLRCLAS